MYKHVFFDLDDTLWDFHANSRDSLKKCWEAFRLDAYFSSFEQYFRIYLNRNNELWDLYGSGRITRPFLMAERFRYPLRQAGTENDELAAQIGEMYLSLLPTRTQLVPCARGLLDYLYPKYTLTIISNGFAGVQHKKLENSRISSYFKHVVLSEDAGALKPDPRIFQYALELNNAQPGEAVMIGDIYQADIAGARAAGICQIFYNWRNTVLDEGQCADYTISSLKEVMNIL